MSDTKFQRNYLEILYFLCKTEKWHLHTVISFIRQLPDEVFLQAMQCYLANLLAVKFISPF